MASEPVVEPSRERRRHGQVERLEMTIKDANGMIAQPFRAYDTLSKMEAHGTITASMRQAGERFHDLFRSAGYDALMASDPRRIPVLTSSSSTRAWSRTPLSDAEWIIRSALDQLGGPMALCGSCAWHVLGLEQTVKEWSLIYRWNKPRGFGFNEKIASGILISSLSILECHYGFNGKSY